MSNTTNSNNNFQLNNPSTRHITIIRNESGYGFTLSRYIIHSNDQQQISSSTTTITSSSSPFHQINNASTKSTTNISKSPTESSPETATPIETVFVKHVRIGGAAYLAGLREGDRIVSINKILLHDKPYSDIIPLIENSGKVLDLIVIPSPKQTETSTSCSTSNSKSSNNSNTNNSINTQSQTNVQQIATTPSLHNTISNTENTTNNSISNANNINLYNSNTTNINSSINKNLSSSSSYPLSKPFITSASSSSILPNQQRSSSANSTATLSSLNDNKNLLTYSTKNIAKINDNELVYDSSVKRIQSEKFSNNNISKNSFDNTKFSLYANNKAAVAAAASPPKTTTNMTSTLSSPSPPQSASPAQNNNNSDDLNSNKNKFNSNTNAMYSSSQASSPLSQSFVSNELNKTNASSSSGIGNLGMSALFYSFLRSNSSSAKNSLTPADSGYDSTKQDHSLNNSSNMSSSSKSSFTNKLNDLSNKPALPEFYAQQQQQLNKSDTPLNKQASSTSSPITQIKLKKLQEALTKHYSKEQLSQLGIIIPGVNTSNYDPSFEASKNNRSSSNSADRFNPDELNMNENSHFDGSFRHQQHKVLNNNSNNYVYSPSPTSTSSNTQMKSPSSKLPSPSSALNRNKASQETANEALARNKSFDYRYFSYPSSAYGQPQQQQQQRQPHPFYYDTKSPDEASILSSNINNSSHFNAYPASFPVNSPNQMNSQLNSRQGSLAGIFDKASNPRQNYIQQSPQQQHINHKSQSPPSSALSPVSVLSSTSLISTSSAASSSSSASAAASSVNTLTTLNNNNHSFNFNNINASLIGNEAGLIGSPNMKTSPFLFSKYIESVHKALHGGGNSSVHGQNGENMPPYGSIYRPMSVASSDLTTTPNEFGNDLADLPPMSPVSKRFGLVENRRQFFEVPSAASPNKQLVSTPSLNQQQPPPRLVHQQSQQLDDDELDLTPTLANSKSPFYFNNYPSAEVSQASKSMELQQNANVSNKNRESSYEMPSSKSINNSVSNVRASSLGIVDYRPSSQTATNANSNNNSTNNNNNSSGPGSLNWPNLRSLSHFNHLNRASYKGECKRIMSRAHMETVAERASHFEEVDMERYNRLKSKFYELDLSQQQELQKQFLLNQYQFPFNHANTNNNTNSSSNNNNNSSNLNLLNNYVESLMMSPSISNYKNSKLNAAKQQTNPNQSDLSNSSYLLNNKAINNANNQGLINNSGLMLKNDYLNKTDIKSQNYDDLVGKYEQNMSKYYTGNFSNNNNNNISNNSIQSSSNLNNYHNVNNKISSSNTISNNLNSGTLGATPTQTTTSTNSNSNSNNTNNTSNNKNMLSHFVGGISNINPNNNKNMSNPNGNHINQIGSSFYYNPSSSIDSKNILNMINNKYLDKDDSNQQQQQNQQLKMFKRRSITSSPVRYNFNSKSSPPVTTRIFDAANIDQSQMSNSDLVDANRSGPYSNTNSSIKRNTPTSPKEKHKKTMLHYNFTANQIMGSDAGETTSTDSDIGTSPSGTTLASPPSSPQQQQQQQQHTNQIDNSNYYFNNNLNSHNNNRYINSNNFDLQQISNDSNMSQSSLNQQLNASIKTPSKSVNNANANNILNNSIVRQHSYLNAVQLNDYKLLQQQQQLNKDGQFNKQNQFNTINENDVYFNNQPLEMNNEQQPYFYSPSSTLMRQQQMQQQQHKSKLSKQNETNHLSIKARSRSSTSKSLNNKSNFAAYPSAQEYPQQQKTQQQQQNEIDLYNQYNRLKSANQRHQLQQRSQTIAGTNDYNMPAENNANDDDLQRNSSYLKAANTPNTPNSSNDSGLFVKPSSDQKLLSNGNNKTSLTNTPQQSRNTSIKKLKNFFGEKTPVVLQAVENKNIIASDEFLNTLLETIKEGVLNCKIVCKDGKRSTDRSWRPAWAVLKKSGALFLCKEKKDNIMIPSVDSYPINLKNSTIDIAYDYTKRKNVFKINTFSNSEYLFQTIDNDSMLEWIRAMQENSTPPDLNKLIADATAAQNSKLAAAAAAANSQQINDENKKLNNNLLIQTSNSNSNKTKSWISMANNSSNSLNEPTNMSSSYSSNFISNDSAQPLQSNKSSNNLGLLINSSGSSASASQAQTPNQSLKQHSFNANMNGSSLYNKSMNNSSELMNLSSPDELNQQNMSPLNSRKEDTSPRRDTNRKWVRQMTRRIRDFMTNTNTGDLTNADLQNSNQQGNDPSAEINRNFGVPLDKCESASTSPYVPVVVEICTRLIELHIIDEGIYRKVGQKQVVTSLRSQLNTGILNIDISDYNWDNPHAVVSLLKCFLNELPDSLTTSHLYNEFIQVCRIDHHHIRLIAIKKLLRKLPIHNYETLKYLTAHLRRVAAAYQHNKMTIKNLCIAFSQSIVRHNDANCETIKTDHVAQSLLIELILIYHDWLFDSNQMDNVPNEIKESVEAHLFQQFCSYIEPTCYTDLLLNIMKAIRARWNSTNSSMNSTNSNTIMSKSGNYNANNSSGNEQDYPMQTSNSRLSHQNGVPQRQTINIQFRSNNKNERMRNAKSVSALSRSRPATQTTAQNQQDTSSSKSPKKQAKQSFNAQKHRSRSVDIRFKSIGAFLSSSSKPAANQSNAVSSADLVGTNKTESNTTPRKSTKTQPNLYYDHNQSSSNNISSSKLQKSTPLTRKSYTEVLKTTPTSNTSTNLTNNTSSSSLLTPQDSNSKYESQQIMNFKLLEKKNELEREKLNQIMKKLEIDLMNAKIDLLEEEDYMRSTPISLLYPSLCMISSSPSVMNENATHSSILKPLHPTIFNSSTLTSSSPAKINEKKLNASIFGATNPNSRTKYLSSSISSSSSTSGVVATTGPSSSSSSVSTSPPLQTNIAKTSAKSGNKLNSLSSISSNSDVSLSAQTADKLNEIGEKAKETSRPSKKSKPARRHTIASSTIDIFRCGGDNQHQSTSEENEFAENEVFDELGYINSERLRQKSIDKANQTLMGLSLTTSRPRVKLIKSNKFKKLNKTALSNGEAETTMSNDLIRLISDNKVNSIKMTSKSVANLPSLTNKTNDYNFKLLKENKKEEQQEQQVKTTILNLSPLSISASSVSTSKTNSSSSISSLINNSNAIKSKMDAVATNLSSEVGSITHTAVNNIQTLNQGLVLNENDHGNEVNGGDDLNNKASEEKFHSLMKKNIQFNCTFESLI